jgi:hypothetical protein
MFTKYALAVAAAVLILLTAAATAVPAGAAADTPANARDATAVYDDHAVAAGVRSVPTQRPSTRADVITCYFH